MIKPSTSQDFSSLSSINKKILLDNHFKRKLGIALINSDSKSALHYNILLQCQDELVSRFGKSIIININEKKFVDCCEDLLEALDKIYDLGLTGKSFIYEMPQQLQ